MTPDAASPDGCVIDKTVDGIGLIEIKCPKTKRNCTPYELCQDLKFYVELIDNKPSLKKNHSYYTQIQMAMGLSRARFCDFIVYTFEGLIIIRIKYSDSYFRTLIKKLNHFYKQYLLPIYYQYGLIKSVNRGRDEKIRNVVVEYQNPNENVKRYTTRSVRTLVLILGVDEIDLSKELFKMLFRNYF